MDINLDEIRSRAVSPKTITNICGVYFLFFNKELVYIGQSTNVFSRVLTHAQEGYKKFTTFSYITVPRSRLNYVELELILKYAPRYNKSFRRPKYGPPRPKELPPSGVPDRTRFDSWESYLDACWNQRRRERGFTQFEVKLILRVTDSRLSTMIYRENFPCNKPSIGSAFFTKEHLLEAVARLQLPLTVDTIAV